jgi:uncharacterized protein
LDMEILGSWFLLFLGGCFAGIVAGLLGIGGGTLMVPLLMGLGASPVQAVATSGLAILITSISGSWANFKMGVLDLKSILKMGIPSILTAQIGVYCANSVSDFVLSWAFVGLLLINIPLSAWGNRLKNQAQTKGSTPQMQRDWPFYLTGSLGGLLSGFFGIGGGLIMVPLQLALLGVGVKAAVQSSLAVIVLTSMAATAGHALHGSVLYWQGCMLGLGGFIVAQWSTRLLPKIPDVYILWSFRTMLLVLAIFMAWKATGYGA